MMATAIYTVLMTIFSYFVDPIRLVDLGFRAIGLLFTAISYVLPDPAATYLAKVSTLFSGDPVHHLLHIFLFLISPIFTPTIVCWCITAEFFPWAVSMVVSLGLAMKGWFWGGGTT